MTSFALASSACLLTKRAAARATKRGLSSGIVGAMILSILQDASVSRRSSLPWLSKERMCYRTSDGYRISDGYRMPGRYGYLRSRLPMVTASDGYVYRWLRLPTVTTTDGYGYRRLSIPTAIATDDSGYRQLRLSTGMVTDGYRQLPLPTESCYGRDCTFECKHFSHGAPPSRRYPTIASLKPSDTYCSSWDCCVPLV